MTAQRLALDDGSLVDVLDRLLDVGAYVDGTVLLTLADVDLVRLDLRLLLASIETLRTDNTPPGSVPTRVQRSPTPAGRHPTGTGHDRRDSPTSEPKVGGHRIHTEPVSTTPRIHTARDLPADEPDDNERPAGIAGLVVFVVDIVRQLLERQALRRMDAGTLTGPEVERLGQSLMALEHQVAELTEFLGQHRRDQGPPGHDENPDRLGRSKLGSGRSSY